jgi:hypothetical protein
MEDFQKLEKGERVTDMYGNAYLFQGIDNSSHYDTLKLFQLGKQEHIRFSQDEVAHYEFKLCNAPRQAAAKPPLFPTEKVDDVTLGGLYKNKNPPTDCPLQIYRVINIFYAHGAPTEITLDKLGGRDFRVDKTHFIENYEELEVTLKTNN